LAAHRARRAGGLTSAGAVPKTSPAPRPWTTRATRSQPSPRRRHPWTNASALQREARAKDEGVAEPVGGGSAANDVSAYVQDVRR